MTSGPEEGGEPNSMNPMTVRLLNTGLLVACFSVLTACGSSPGQPAPPPEGTTLSGSDDIPDDVEAGQSRDGISYEIYIQSHDNEQIAFTVHEPSTLEGDETYPLVLQGHGFGGSRTRTRTGTIGRLLDEGYGVISIDQRGFGETGGTIRVMDPDFEGRYNIAIVDWAEENLPWLAYANDNLVLGAIGGSYGGGYQLMLNAVDPKRRLDAIVPDITWHDLRYSLYPPEGQGDETGALKGTWVLALFSAGNAGSGANFDQEFIDEVGSAVSTSTFSDSVLETFYEHSPGYWCDGNTETAEGLPGSLNPVNVLFTQGLPDSLFNATESWWNYECYSNMPGAKDVRLYWHNSGHIVPPPANGQTSQNCGPVSHEDATLAWFDEYLRGNSGAADGIGEFCVSLTPGDDLIRSDVQVGGTDTTLTTTNVLVSPTTTLLYTATGDEILAGIPQLELELTGLGVDPIVMIGLVTSTATAPPWVAADQQLHPLRGYGTHSIDMGGIAERLEAGDTVSLVAYLIESQEYASVVGEGTVTLSGTVSLPLFAAP